MHFFLPNEVLKQFQINAKLLKKHKLMIYVVEKNRTFMCHKKRRDKKSFDKMSFYSNWTEETAAANHK